MSDSVTRYFVYWNSGSCQDGSHSIGLEAFDTLGEAIEEVRRLRRCLEDKDSIVVIDGSILEV